MLSSNSQACLAMSFLAAAAQMLYKQPAVPEASITRTAMSTQPALESSQNNTVVHIHYHNVIINSFNTTTTQVVNSHNDNSFSYGKLIDQPG
jgi:hypothetical protein